MIAMKEKDMLKNMFEQEHSSKALDMSADEILTANLGHGARVRSRGFAGAAIAAAAVLAVGVGAFALNSGMETADPQFTATNTSAASKVTDDTGADASGTDYKTKPPVIETYRDRLIITLLNDSGAACRYDITDTDTLNYFFSFADSFISSPHSDLDASDVDKDSFDDCEIEFDDSKNGRALFARMNSSGNIELCYAQGDDRSAYYYIDGSRNKELYDVLVKCKEAGKKQLDEQNTTNPYDMSVYIKDEDNNVTNIDLKKHGIDYSELAGKTDAFYKAFKADTLPDGVTVKEADDWDEIEYDHTVEMSIGNARLAFDMSGEDSSALYFEEIIYDGLEFKSSCGYEISDASEIYVYLHDMWGKVNNDKTADEKPTTTVTEKTPDAKSTEVEAKKPDNESDEPATTTVTYDPKDSYTPDEIQPLPRGEIDFADNPTIVHFTRSVDSSLPQADMSFRLIDEYDDLLKGMYAAYKSGELKPAETLTMDDEPEQITGGTAMTVYWTRDDGGMVEFMGVDMDGQKAYIRLTDLDEKHTCGTGKVHYFSTDSEMYQMLWKIWGFYYPVYENVDEMP